MVPWSKQWPNSAKQCHTPGTPTTRLQGNTELHQKDLRKSPKNVHIQGPVHEAVSAGGHLSGLKSNR